MIFKKLGTKYSLTTAALLEGVNLVKAFIPAGVYMIRLKDEKQIFSIQHKRFCLK